MKVCVLGGGCREWKREGELDGEIWKCRKKTIMLYVSPSVLTSLFLSLFLRLSFSLVLLVFIVITTAAPLESSTFFSTGAINEEGLTPFSSSSSPFSSLLQVPRSSPFSPLVAFFSVLFSSLLCAFPISNLILIPPLFFVFCPTFLVSLLFISVYLSLFFLHYFPVFLSFFSFLIQYGLFSFPVISSHCILIHTQAHTRTHTEDIECSNTCKGQMLQP